MEDALPFILAIAIVVLQPIYDKPWVHRWETQYQARRNSLEGGAHWIATVSSFLPNTVLTIYGAALLLDIDEKTRLAHVTAIIVFILASFAIYLHVAMSGVGETRPILRNWSYPHFWLVTLNIVGILVATTT